MSKNSPYYTQFDFYTRFGRPHLDIQGEEHYPIVNDFIQQLSTDAVVAFDLRGLEYFGYSYAKQTIRRVLRQRNQGEYAQRQFFLVSDQKDDFLDGLTAALREKSMFMLVSPDMEHPFNKGTIVGEIPDYVKATFDVLCQKAPISTGSLAQVIGQSPQNTKKRLDRLYEMGLLRREKIPSPSGGLEWINSIF